MKLVGGTHIASFAAAAALASIAAAAAPTRVQAQPEPSFRADCAGLRAAIEALAPEPDELVTIQVVGPLTEVHSDGALAYLAMCAPPDPQVLCVTYDAGGRAVGDAVALTGAYSRHGPDHILLDPCLPSAAEGGRPAG